MKRLLCFIVLVALCAVAQTPAARDSVGVEFTLSHANGSSAAGFIQGETAAVRFTVRDKSLGTPLEGRHPAAWLDLHDEAEAAAPIACRDRVKRLLNASSLARPELDLNTYYVLIMNGDASITVVDPIFGYGKPRAIATIRLPEPAVDWTFSGDRKRLFVSLPRAGQIVVVETATWGVVRTFDVGPGLARLVLQPDGKRIWAAFESGIAAVDTAEMRVAGTVLTGSGPHEIALSSDNLFAFVTNARSVSIVDTGKLVKLRDLQTGRNPGSIAFSSKSQMAYVSDSQDGTISVISGARAGVAATIAAEPGLGVIRFARDGRFGILLNPVRNRIHVLDSSVNRIVQTGDAPHTPDQVTFSATLAYIRQRESDSVLMLPLDKIGGENKGLPIADFPAGQHPLGKFTLPSAADSMVQAPGENAVLVANPADRAVYYYEEGMAAPIGYFSNTAGEPRALLVLNRGLTEVSKGMYETTTRLERSGVYTMAFLLDSPSAVQCWDITVQPDPKLPPPQSRVEVESLADSRTLDAGHPFTLRFRIRDAATKAAKTGSADVRAMIFRAPGAWHRRISAQAREDGVYEVAFPAIESGVYFVNLESPSLGLNLNGEPFVFQAVSR